MSNEEKSADAQGVKAYRVNDDAIKAMDFARFHDLCAIIGFYPNNAEAQGVVVDGFSSTGHEYECILNPAKFLLFLMRMRNFAASRDRTPLTWQSLTAFTR